eukprot:CAMPEP_0194087558 /NCGR_PEP_ID=MMETSP0149-20130528/25568_1 /TAXON_ID=122233 /ORGANISM="Chaetoceros debilis, Strain MM31A-1" /LENGTH=338 /DNA_ID=CAMNT_0038770943 /DNA_START=6 /DNA_END=1022 /DNA_ORIENTATION=-
MSSRSTFTIPYETSNSTLVESLLGGLAVSMFVATWISSLFSPILFVLSIRNEKYLITAFITTVAIAAYLPWKKGPISRAFTSFLRTHAMYYKKCAFVFCGESNPEEAKLKSKSKSESDTSKPMFFAVHPHGAFCSGWSLLVTAPFMTSVRFCFSPALYYSPFFKLFCRLGVKPGKADKASMIGYMKKGENLALPPGGFEEATITGRQDRAYIKKRPGFIKLCLKHGYSVVPVYVFGENLLFSNVQGMWKLRLWINSLGMPAVAVWGSAFLPLAPQRHPCGIHIVAGEPLDLPKIEDPTREEVKKWHDKYMAELTKIFEEHKCDAYGEEEGKTMKLELW